MGGLFEGCGEGAGREGRAGAGGRDEEGMRVGTTKGRHLPERKGRPFGEAEEANYS